MSACLGPKVAILTMSLVVVNSDDRSIGYEYMFNYSYLSDSTGVSGVSITIQG